MTTCTRLAPQPYGEHPVVLLGGVANALSAARSLGRAGCEVHVGLEASGADHVAASRHVRSWMRPASAATAPDEWLEWAARTVPAGAVVLPCSDPALALVARSREQLAAAGLVPPESDDALVLALLDKELTYRRVRAAGLRAPRTCVVTGVEQGLAAAEAFALPFAVKPRVSYRFLRQGDRTPKAVVVTDRRDLEPALRRVVAQRLPVVLTEIVPGADDEYVSYYGYVDVAGRELLHVTKRKLRQHPVGFGSGTYHAMSADPEVREAGRRLFAALGLRGLGNAEFKRDARDGELVVIECNLRLTAATELVRRAGVDLADVVYRRALGLQVDPVDGHRTDLRQWLPVHDLLALRDYRRDGVLTAPQWLASVARPQTFPVLSADDLGPSRARCADVVRTAVRRAGNRTVRQVPHHEVPAREVGLHLLAAAVPVVGGRGRLARAALAEAGVLAGVGPRGYRERWRDGCPVPAATPGRSALYRRYWTEAAAVLGATVEDLGDGLLRLGVDGASTLVWDSLVGLDDPLVLRLAGHKPTARGLLRSAGLPVSAQLVCTSGQLHLAARFLSRHGRVVVKPAQSGGGDGVTCGVSSPGELVAAFALALRCGEQVVLEELVTGQELRLLVVGGRVVSAVRRRPPRVRGDGSSTVARLVAQENARRRQDPAGAGLYPLRVDLDLALTLRRAGLRLSAVPAPGQVVQVKTAVNENGPQDNELVDPAPALVEAAEQAAAAIGVELAAVEIITPRPDAPLERAGGRVVEVNTTPGLHYHYQVVDPAGRTPVAVSVLDHLLRKAAAATAARVVLTT